jgi:NAD(P)-dependent dehydrogenase (short-subunit alcohol dehydrogenase family)
MLNDLTGKRAMVTGGSRGIGRAICERLVEAGVEVAFCGRTETNVREGERVLREGGDKVWGSAVDLQDTGAIAAWFAETRTRWGRLDILVNNAGLAVFGNVGSLTLEDWRRTIDTNLTAVFACCREAVPLMSGGGSVVNVGSLASRYAFDGGGAYNASKFGLLGLSEAFMLDYRAEGIRVSTVLPGSVDTEFSPRSKAGNSSWKLAAEDVAEVVMTILRMPERALVSCVEMRPSQTP